MNYYRHTAAAIRDADAPNGSVRQLLDESSDCTTALGARLRERIYVDVVPALAKGVAKATPGKRDVRLLREIYNTALIILFRLLFVAYVEDQLLLPYRRSLRSKATELTKRAREGRPTWDEEPTYWNEFLALYAAIDRGNAAWGVPAYNIGLFSSDPATSPTGATIAGLLLPDTVMGPVLLNLLVDRSSEGILGPVDFRSLGVREFGTIYEGLLESDLAFAQTPLTLREGAYAPARAKRDEVKVAEGDVYLRNRQGARKSTGSFFTKSVIVDHLYGLTESHLRHIFETFHEGWEYQMDLDATLKHFHAWGRRRVVALGDGRSAFG